MEVEKSNKINRIKNLIIKLNQYRDSYYNKSISVISDYEYDKLFDELKSLEKETGIIMVNSPTQTVGYEVKSKLEKVKHSHPMLSLDKTKSIDDLKEFAGNQICLLMNKLDGLTILLTYEKGKLIRAETRGNGEEGEDITHNAKAFSNIPLNINCNEKLEIEGEAIITYEDFERINSKLSDEEKYKNPRNLVSGSVRQLDSKIAADRNIKFIVWKIPSGMSENSMYHRLNNAYNLGFDIVPTVVVGCKDTIEESVLELKKTAEKLSYPIDGHVITYDDIKYGKSLGETGHHPKHSIAYKFYDEEVSTILKKIEWTMGKTGVLTPVAVFEPVEIDGTTVERASLHNISIMEKLSDGAAWYKGMSVTVYKANQIIPQISSVVVDTKHQNKCKINELFSVPYKCPFCNSDTEKIKQYDTEILTCTNNECNAKLLGKMTHFCSKNAMNIEGMSEATIQFLIDKGWIRNFKDLYRLKYHEEEWCKCEGFGKKSVSKLLESIENSRMATLDRFIYSLSIPHIGRTASKTINKWFNGKSVVFYEAWLYGFNFSILEDFGDAMNKSMQNFVRHNCHLVSELLNEFTFEQSKVVTDNKKELACQTFVITGSLEHFKNRDAAKERIEELGGKVSGSISSKTNYLVNNDIHSTSGKNKKAKELNIPIITEEQLLEMIK